MPVASMAIPLSKLSQFGNGLSKRVASLISAKQEAATRPIAVTKPSTRLGGSYAADKVAQVRPVVFCTSCMLRYRNWWKREHYRGDWGWGYVGDCDGCGIHGCKVTLFAREDMFYRVLSDAHGREPKPY